MIEVNNKGVYVTVITRPPQDFDGDNKEAAEECLKELSALGVCVKFRSNFHQKFTVIDSHIVWYGSVNFLGYGTAEESIMRFESYDMAGEPVETVI